ncbi:hypothetical protein BD311DRAFT_402452 [Dichomitus squalens]|uniref:Uncharacterized protein n=1 Tax=Dichomitus squalens TaxID=114155 RepID=A0A4Q9MI80_9APHY|nr:hypothetical protein BD311DRAFT_402452 [Dichomitus squalens]
MRHPFAVAISYPRPSSFLPIRSRPNTPEADIPPHSIKAWLIDDDSRPPVPALPRAAAPHAESAPNLPRLERGSTSGHYVKHSSKLTLLLSGQREGTSIPHYSNGDTIEGILAIARPEGVLALDVKIEGRTYVEEVAGGGTVSVKTINDKIYSWSASNSEPFPPRASFRYTLPSTYRDSSVGKDYPLPPSYTAELYGIPGFTVKIAYAVVVNLTVLREPSTLWRGVSKWVCSGVPIPTVGGADRAANVGSDPSSSALPHACRVRVPFRYSHRTRPTLSPPFSRNPQRTETPQCPRTLWTFKLRGRKADVPGIKVDLYLPCSAVCCSQEPIPFHITLFADEGTLEPFAEYRPMPSSFLPLSPSSSNLNAPFESVQTQLSSRKAAHRCPLKIKVQRTTIVDASSAGLGLTMQSPSYALGSTGSGRPLDAVRDMFTRSDVSHASSGSGRSRRSEKEREKASMHSSHAIGQGIVHSASRRSNSIVWSGAIVIPPSAEGFNGGFEINGLKVVVSVLFEWIHYCCVIIYHTGTLMPVESRALLFLLSFRVSVYKC